MYTLFMSYDPCFQPSHSGLIKHQGRPYQLYKRPMPGLPFTAYTPVRDCAQAVGGYDHVTP